MGSKAALIVVWLASLALVPSSGFAGPCMGVSSADRVSFSTLPHASRNTFLCTTIADSQSDEEKQLSFDTVAELIDTTFVNACMQLSKG
jgi:hypothetical protein